MFTFKPSFREALRLIVLDVAVARCAVLIFTDGQGIIESESSSDLVEGRCCCGLLTSSDFLLRLLLRRGCSVVSDAAVWVVCEAARNNWEILAFLYPRAARSSRIIFEVNPRRSKSRTMSTADERPRPPLPARGIMEKRSGKKYYQLKG